jgi:hypothetical protein
MIQGFKDLARSPDAITLEAPLSTTFASNVENAFRQLLFVLPSKPPST